MKQKINKTGRRLFSFLLALVLVMSNFTGIVPGMSLTAQAAGEKAYAAYYLQAGEEDGLPPRGVFRMGVPYQEEGCHGHEPVHSDAVEREVWCQTGFRVAQEGANDEQGKCPDQDVSGRGFPAVTFAVAVFDGIWD